MIIKEEDKVILFCGSGISFNSNLPTVNPLLKYFFGKLTENQKNSKKLFRLYESNKIPFEHLFSLLERYLDTSNFFKIFESNNYNINHLVFIRLAMVGTAKVIITTNFDTLFESAYDSLDRKENFVKKYVGSSYLNSNSKDKSVPLIKIHGCVLEIDSMKNTMEKVSNRAWVLEVKKNIQKVIDDFNINKILFFGYSFSDNFDINPALDNIDFGNIEIIILDHKKGVHDIVLKEDEKYKTPKFSKNESIYHADTNWLVKELAEQFQFKHPNTTEITKSEKWQLKIDKWIAGLENGKKELSVAFLFERLKEYNISIYYLNKLLKISDKISNELLFFTYDLLAINYLELGGLSNYKAAFKKIQKAEKYSQNLSIGHQTKFFQTKGVYHHYMDSHGGNSSKNNHRREAFNAFHESIEKAQKNNNMKSVAVTKLSLSNLYRKNENYDKAYSAYRESYKIKSKLGDLKGKGNCFHGLGNICLEKKDYKSARSLSD